MRDIDTWIEAGTITRAHGVRGDVIVDLKPDLVACLTERIVLRTMTPGGAESTLEIERVRDHSGRVLVKFLTVETRTAAERLRGVRLWIDREDVGPLGDDRWFVQDLIGLEVYSEDGERIGELVDVMPQPANDVYVVHGPSGEEILLPAIEQVIRTVDLEKRTMVVHLMKGLRREDR
ncbi:MAG: 16S rRNA processing protein RimM [Candidatus Eisenbacteria bacterium]|nr:16S rRNA processing protein RimM [Candidatus Eisenbacteria bacterium]